MILFEFLDHFLLLEEDIEESRSWIFWILKCVVLKVLVGYDPLLIAYVLEQEEVKARYDFLIVVLEAALHWNVLGHLLEVLEVILDLLSIWELLNIVVELDTFFLEAWRIKLRNGFDFDFPGGMQGHG